MSALAYYEPHKISAGALALVVHTVFFSLLYFGVNWHVKTPQTMQVEMWERLPEPVPEILPEPIPPQPALPKAEPIVAPKVVEPVAPPKADIELKDKKKKKTEKIKKAKPAAKVPPKLDAKAQKRELEMQRAAEARMAHENARIQELQAKMRAEMDAATRGEVERYTGLIGGKISRNIVMPPDVPENAEAIFMVIVLPDGSVMDNPKLLKSSGNAAYDSAAERAIYKAQPLPLPRDPALARMFRELRLSVKP